MMVLAVVVLLPTSYVAFFLAVSYANGAGRIPQKLEPLIGLMCLPAGLYVASELPGSSDLQAASEWSWQKGAESKAE